MSTKNKLYNIAPPKKVCEDKNCPFHGNLKVRGKAFEGTVISDKMQGSVVVQWSEQRKVPKYERFKKVTFKLHAHSTPCVHARKGDVVKIAECRSLSKTKNFVVLGVVGKESVKAQVKDIAVKTQQAEKASENKTQKKENLDIKEKTEE